MSLTQYLKENNLKNTKEVKNKLAKKVEFFEYSGTAADNKKLVALLTNQEVDSVNSIIDANAIVNLYTLNCENANVKEYSKKIVLHENQKDAPKGFSKTSNGYLVKL